MGTSDKLTQTRISNSNLLNVITWKFYWAKSSDINWKNGRFQYLNITANTTITFANGVPGTTYVFKFNNPAGHTITWPTNIRWPGGYVPTTGITYIGFLYIIPNPSVPNVAYYDNIALAEDLQEL